MMHEDGGAYAHVVATVSLGAGMCLDVGGKIPAGDEDEDDDQVGSSKESMESEGGRGREGVSDGDGTQEDRKKDLGYGLPTRILQERRSLLVTMGEAYTGVLHGIAPVEVDEGLGRDTVANWELLGEREGFERDGGRNVRGTRVSLTYRDVLKVSRAAGKVFGLGRR